MDSHPFARRHGENVVAKVFTALDVILVVVGPVQLYLFAFVGNGIDARSGPRILDSRLSEILARDQAAKLSVV